MIAIIKSELLKIRTARSSLILCLIGFGLAVVISLLSGLFASFEGVASPGDDMISTGQLVFFFTLVIGVLAVGGEFRHGSIAPALLVTPRRRELLAGKLVAVVIVSALLAILSVGGSALAGAIALLSRGINFGAGFGEVIEAIGVAAGVAALYGAVGLGTGAVLRNQTGAIVLVLIWLFVIEGIIGAYWGAYQPYSLGGALSAAANEDAGLANPLSQAGGFLVGGAYAVVLSLGGALVLEKSDITG